MRPTAGPEHKSPKRDPDAERGDSGQPAHVESGPISDEALARSTITDRAAYIELYRRYLDSVYSYFSWKFGHVVAEDLASETFERAPPPVRRPQELEGLAVWHRQARIPRARAASST